MSQLEMVFWDVQHGHSTYIKTPNNRHIVIDLGTGDYSGLNKEFSPLLHLKNVYRVERLDYVIITHPHLDHIDDILNFDALSPRVLLRPKSISNAKVMENVRDQDRAKFAKYCEINDRYTENVAGTVNDPTMPENWGGVKITPFQPQDRESVNFNNHSIVTVVEFEGIKVVIPGDNEKSSLDELLKNNIFKDAVRNADILLAPHHGRDSGYNSDFVDLVNPRITVVSDGRFCETSANGNYSAKSRGWEVETSTVSEQRRCLTTNSDGEIYVRFGRPSAAQNRYLIVKKAGKPRAQSATG